MGKCQRQVFTGIIGIGNAPVTQDQVIHIDYIAGDIPAGITDALSHTGRSGGLKMQPVFYYRSVISDTAIGIKGGFVHIHRLPVFFA